MAPRSRQKRQRGPSAPVPSNLYTRAVAVSLNDDNTQDLFVVRVSQDSVYGTPIFTTMGGRSSCVGETGTTRRDSRVTIKEINGTLTLSSTTSTVRDPCPFELLPHQRRGSPGDFHTGGSADVLLQLHDGAHDGADHGHDESYGYGGADAHGDLCPIARHGGALLRAHD